MSEKGGRRPGAGRPKGAKNKKTLLVEAAVRAIGAGQNAPYTSLSLIQQVYRDETQPQATRLAAAAQALPYEHPKLASVTHRGDAESPIHVINQAAGLLDGRVQALAERRAEEDEDAARADDKAADA